MTAEVGQTGGLSIAGFARFGAGSSKRERNFYIALACAAILHASFFISAVETGDAKRLGAEKGADDAISVSLVTEQDLKSTATAADEASPPPGPVAPTQEQQPATPPPQPQQQPQDQQPPAPPQPEQAKQEPQPPEPQAQDTPQPPDTPQPDMPQADDPAKPETVAKQEEASPDSQPQNLFSLDDQDPSKLQSADEPKPKPKQETKHETKKPSTTKATKKSSSKSQNKLASLDLSAQALAPSLSGGGGAAAFQRPPGITRSGLNDAFARAVIRALQQTMPQLSNTLGRVTVRIFLSDNGNVISVTLLAGSKDPSLNQDVVFAAKQTSYPIPPAGSNEADRTFMVTYIYD